MAEESASLEKLGRWHALSTRDHPMIEPSHSEIGFIRRLEKCGGTITVQGEIRLLKIGRLVPEFVTHASGGSQTGHFSLTQKGWELARKISGAL